MVGGSCAELNNQAVRAWQLARLPWNSGRPRPLLPRWQSETHDLEQISAARAEINEFIATYKPPKKIAGHWKPYEPERTVGYLRHLSLVLTSGRNA